MKRIETLLSREIGLAAHSIGAAAIELAVRARMVSRQVSSVDAYLGYLNELDERRALVEEIVVSETWFFRDEGVFRALREFALERQKGAPSDLLLRVLCIPCATGEEPYSAAITLLEAGFPPSRFSIHGTDVSERALDRARWGIYGKNSFRAAQRPEYAHYFEERQAGLAVTAEARSSVTFARGNVLDPFVTQGSLKFDVVFCRNLLIYLDSAARSRALDNIHGWLAQGGIVFGGHAEALETMDPRFARLEGSSHCAYARRSEAEHARQVPRALKPTSLKASKPAKPAPATNPKPASSPIFRAPSPEAAEIASPASRLSPTASLELVERLANRGDRAAEGACARHISEHGPSAEAYCLLGVIRQAMGAEQGALECFNKALYLDQAHYTSLVHLALLHERRRDAAAAANYRRRAERAKSKRVRP